MYFDTETEQKINMSIKWLQIYMMFNNELLQYNPTFYKKRNTIIFKHRSASKKVRVELDVNTVHFKFTINGELTFYIFPKEDFLSFTPVGVPLAFKPEVIETYSLFIKRFIMYCNHLTQP